MFALLLLFACSNAPHAHGDGAPHVHDGAAPHAHDGAAPHAHDGAAPHAHDGAATPQGGVGHDATPHSHSAGHGGEVKTAGDLHVEARFMKSGVMVWLTDAAEKPVDLSQVTAGAVVKTTKGVDSVPMSLMGDHLHAAVALEEGTSADAVLTITYAGKPVSIDFRTEKVGALAEHDHTSLHGGVVGMWGDYHVEYLVQDGEVRFWMSDAHRVAIKDGVSGTAKFGDTVVPLTFDPATGLLSGKATPAAGQMVMLDAKVGETTFSLAFGG